MRNEINVLIEDISYDNIDLSLSARVLNEYSLAEFRDFCANVDEHKMKMTKATFQLAKSLLLELDEELENQSNVTRANIQKELTFQFPDYDIDIISYSHDPINQIQIDSEFLDSNDDEDRCYSEQELMRSVNCIVDDTAALTDFNMIHELRDQIENLCDQAEGE